MAESMLQKVNQRYNITANNSGNATFITESAMRALELVRISIQDTFNQEVHQLIKKYTEVLLENNSNVIINLNSINYCKF